MSQKSLHHSFDIDLATEYGMSEAVLIHHFQHWIRINKRLKRNSHDGRTWTYQSMNEILAHFPYWSEDDLRGVIERLCTGKGRRSQKNKEDHSPILIKGNFNKTPFDKTTWYAFIDEDRFVNSNNSYEREISQIDPVNLPNRAGDLPNGDGCPPTPIPDTKTDTKTEFKKERAQEKSFGAHVRLSEDVLKELHEKHTEPVISRAIDEINDYLSSTGRKPYKDYAAAIRNWLKRDFNRTSSKEEPPSNKKTNLLTAREAQSQLRASGSMKSKEFFISDKELVRLDTGERVLLSSSPDIFEETMLEIFNLEKSDE